MKCPLCGCETFFVKNPDDEFETCEFNLQNGNVQFSSNVDVSSCPEVGEDTETYCDKCSWHGRFKELGNSSE